MEIYKEPTSVVTSATLKALTTLAIKEGFPQELAENVSATLYGKLDMYFIDQIQYSWENRTYTLFLKNGSTRFVSRDSWISLIVLIVKDYNESKSIADTIKKF